VDPVSPRVVIGLSLAAAAALASAVAVALASVHGSAPVAVPAQAFDGALMPPGVRAPDFALRDQYGRPLTMHQFLGRPVVVTFLYTTCRNSCPAEAQQIKGAFDDLGHDLPALAISVDPAHDTPASARHFLAEQGMTGRIRFVLGTPAQLAPLWHRYAVTPQTPRAEHMALIVLLDRRGVMRVTYPQSQTTPERLAHDLRLLERD
jgi:protein SCO1